MRAVQTAAIRGDAASQNALGVMYAHGIGVITNYVRAEYWFQKGRGPAQWRRALSSWCSLQAGPDGIHQDLSKANDFFTASALAGFRPTMNSAWRSACRRFPTQESAMTKSLFPRWLALLF